MITDPDIAHEVNERVIKTYRLLDEAITLVQERCSQAEANEFKIAVARVLAELLFEVANPLYRRHPGIAPEGLCVPGVSNKN